MTSEDLAQITAVIAAAEQRTNAATSAAEQRTNAATSAAIAAAEQRTNAAITASEERTTAAIAAAEERIGVRQDRLLESIAAEFSTVRAEMKGRFQSIEIRLDRIENLGYSMNMQTAGMSKAIGDGERLMSEIIARQSAQQQAFFELQTRVAKIERKIHPE
jgi:hypothetical protein